MRPCMIKNILIRTQKTDYHIPLPLDLFTQIPTITVIGSKCAIDVASLLPKD